MVVACLSFTCSKLQYLELSYCDGHGTIVCVIQYHTDKRQQQLVHICDASAAETSRHVHSQCVYIHAQLYIYLPLACEATRSHQIIRL